MHLLLTFCALLDKWFNDSFLLSLELLHGLLIIFVQLLIQFLQFGDFLLSLVLKGLMLLLKGTVFLDHIPGVYSVLHHTDVPLDYLKLPFIAFQFEL